MSELEKLAFYSKIGHAVEHVAEKIGKGIKSAEKKLGANAQKIEGIINSTGHKILHGVATVAKYVKEKITGEKKPTMADAQKAVENLKM